MTWDRVRFKQRYIASGRSAHGANSYVSYLNRAERVLGDLAAAAATPPPHDLIGRAERLPSTAWGGERNKRDSLSALRCFVSLMAEQGPEPCASAATGAAAPPRAARASPPTALSELVEYSADEIIALLQQAQELGARYYALTGKPLGVAGEVAELEAMQKLGVELCEARNPGFDGWMEDGARRLRVQIKGRAVSRSAKYRGRCPSFKTGDQFDVALLVLMDRVTLEAIEIWQATEEAVAAALAAPGSKARNERGALGISQFKRIAKQCWSEAALM